MNQWLVAKNFLPLQLFNYSYYNVKPFAKVLFSKIIQTPEFANVFHCIVCKVMCPYVWYINVYVCIQPYDLENDNDNSKKEGI